MALELRSQSINLNETVVLDVGQIVVEGDVIVPDIKPDIYKILQAEGFVRLLNKDIQSDKIVLSGAVDYKILYVPEDKSTVKSISTSQPFNYTAAINNGGGDLSAFPKCEVEHVEFSVHNPRKLNIKAVVAFNINVQKSNVLDMATGFSEEYPIETFTKAIKTYAVTGQREAMFTIQDELVISQEKPCILDMLKVDTSIINKDFKVINGKVIAKGELLITPIYVGEASENVVDFMEFSIPFSEVIDIDGANEDVRCELDYHINSVDFSINPDSDGDVRLINANVDIAAHVKVGEDVVVQVLSDCYGTDSDLDISTAAHNLEEIVCDSTGQCCVKEIVSIPHSLPEIKQVYNVIAKPYITQTDVLPGKITVDGVVDTYILYVSDNQENPIYSYKKEMPFSQTLSAQQAMPGMKCDVKAEVWHINYSINAAAELDTRITLNFEAKVISSSSVNLISSVEALPLATVAKARPSLLIYFVQSNESLWDIAKKYKTTIQDILEANGITRETVLSQGQQLLIPRPQKREQLAKEA